VRAMSSGDHFAGVIADNHVDPKPSVDHRYAARPAEGMTEARPRRLVERQPLSAAWTPGRAVRSRTGESRAVACAFERGE
jgi:hypothetical protein